MRKTKQSLKVVLYCVAVSKIMLSVIGYLLIVLGQSFSLQCTLLMNVILPFHSLPEHKSASKKARCPQSAALCTLHFSL